MERFPLILGGQTIAAESYFGVVNPATGTVFAEAPACTPGQLEVAAEAAAAALPAWAEDEAARRLALSEAALRLRAAGDELARTLTTEQGKPLAQARDEVLGAAACLEFNARLALPRETIGMGEHSSVEVCPRPLGVVAAITPWNYPLLLAAWKFAPALLAGNTVLLKPSPFTPLSSLRIAELLRETLPPGVLQVICGHDELGRLLVEHPRVRKVSFTGSIATGQKVAAAAARDLKRVTLELGGNDAAIVLPDVDIEACAADLFWGAFGNSGQICVAIKRLYVHEGIAERLTTALVHLATSAIVGDGLDPQTELGPVNNETQLRRVSELVEDARRAGGTVVCGGSQLERPGYFYPPTIVTGVHKGVRLVDEEQFGPALPLVTFRDVEQALAEANGTCFGLGGSIWTRDLARGAQLAARLQCGSAWVNSHGMTPSEVPFGGWKHSGLGLENGTWGLLEYCALQALYRAE